MTTYVWFVRGATHAAMCRTSIEAARRVAGSGDKFLVVTDEPYRLSEESRWTVAPQADSVEHIPGGEPIMVANIDAQITALLSGDDEFVFLDTDVLLLKPIPLLGELTITWRDHVLVGDE